MKELLIICFCWLTSLYATAQVLEEEQLLEGNELENLAGQEEEVKEDDSRLQLLNDYLVHPVGLNEATEQDLKNLGLLNELQIANFCRYRSIFGPIISLYELQAIPGWDIALIRKLLPFVSLSPGSYETVNLANQLKAGDYSLLARYARVLEKQDEYRNAAAGLHYLGNADRFLLRFRYNYGNQLQYGFTTEKDPGEPMFYNGMKFGFDFFSFHFFVRRNGLIRAIALGDFSINLGQGLIQWQAMAFGKGASVLSVKREGPVLRPYNSAGEFNFHRGAAITVGRRRWEASLFVSHRSFSANIIHDSLSLPDRQVSTISSSGYHRTLAEIEDRNNISALMGGGSLEYKMPHGNFAFNVVQYHFGIPFAKRGEPFNIYAFSGKALGNYSISYGFTHNNMHWFGELAMDNESDRAWLAGMIASLDPAVDLSLLWRNFGERFHSLFSNAFSVSSTISNERGCYAGLECRPGGGWKISSYLDVFRFPWLKYNVDAPGDGREFLLQASFAASKNTELSGRYRFRARPRNEAGTSAALAPVLSCDQEDWRVELKQGFGRAFSLLHRVEYLAYRKGEGYQADHGFTCLMELAYRSPGSFHSSVRWQYFETDNYDARIYAYESDVLYSYSVPSFYGKGFRTYFNLAGKLRQRRVENSKGIHFQYWLRLARTFSINYARGLADENILRGNTECKLQLQLTF